MDAQQFEAFAVFPPGLEEQVGVELQQLGFVAHVEPGGATFWTDVAGLELAHLWLRIPTKILVRVSRARVRHLAQLRQQAANVDWHDYLRPGDPVRIKVASRHSKLYHTGAIADRIRSGIGAVLGVVPPKAAATEGGATLQARLLDDWCTLSVDASGEPLYRRGGKQRVAKAPLRENLAAGLLMLANYSPEQPFLDPMCGSGTLVIEAARIAMNIPPGAEREFAFMHWPSHCAERWRGLLARARAHQREAVAPIQGGDRDAGAVASARENARRAGVSAALQLRQQALSYWRPPADAQTGLILTNPPYGQRVSHKQRGQLRRLYGALGALIRTHFPQWRVGIITSDAKLAYATGLKGLQAGPYLPHGGIKIRLFAAPQQTEWA